jgi:hypothetical protein
MLKPQLKLSRHELVRIFGPYGAFVDLDAYQVSALYSTLFLKKSYIFCSKCNPPLVRATDFMFNSSSPGALLQPVVASGFTCRLCSNCAKVNKQLTFVTFTTTCVNFSDFNRGYSRLRGLIKLYEDCNSILEGDPLLKPSYSKHLNKFNSYFDSHE